MSQTMRMMSLQTRSYSELRRILTFEERYEYLALRGTVGQATFGFDRWINQRFYRSPQWHQIRDVVILRDNGCDLGIPGHEIHGRLLVHHMNPLIMEDFSDLDLLLDPEFLITVTHQTHNAIHYGDDHLLPRAPVERRPGDTRLW